MCQVRIVELLKLLWAPLCQWVHVEALAGLEEVSALVWVHPI